MIIFHFMQFAQSAIYFSCAGCIKNRTHVRRIEHVFMQHCIITTQHATQHITTRKNPDGTGLLGFVVILQRLVVVVLCCILLLRRCNTIQHNRNTTIDATPPILKENRCFPLDQLTNMCYTKRKRK